MVWFTQEIYAQLPSSLLAAVAEAAARRMSPSPNRPDSMEEILAQHRRHQMCVTLPNALQPYCQHDSNFVVEFDANLGQIAPGIIRPQNGCVSG